MKKVAHPDRLPLEGAGSKISHSNYASEQDVPISHSCNVNPDLTGHTP